MRGTSRRLGVLVAALAGALALAHCAASADESAGKGGGFGGSGGGLLDGSTGAGFGGTGGSGGSPPPPEEELESSFLSPVATGKFVWTANPDSGRVALVDAETFDVKTIEAGFAPTHLAAIPAADGGDSNTAVVLNVLSRDATLLRATDEGEVFTVAVDTHEGANAWAISPGGRWAVAWTDARSVEAPDPTEGFQDVTVIDLTEGSESSLRLTVGYRPTRIAFSDDESNVYAVTEPGVSVIVLDETFGPRVDRLIEVSDDPLENPASRDVTILPDGSLALVRRDGSADVSFVDLESGSRTAVTLSGEVTDLDLAADGDRAVAVVRENAELSILPIPDVVDDPTAVETVAIEGETFGSVALPPDAAVALLYTNAIPNDHLTIVQTAFDENYLSHRTVSVKTPIKAVFPAEDAQNAITFQEAGSSQKKGAFSIVPTGFLRSPKIVGTDAPPVGVALSPPPQADRALVTVRDDASKTFGVYVVRLPNLQVDFVRLASAPLAAGMVPDANKGFVAQAHPEGRITFVDLADGSARTLTGFELGSKVVD